MNKTELLNKIQAYRFAAYDLLLYLDTHPDDKKAFSMYCDLSKKAEEYINEYEKKHGSLSIFGLVNAAKFDWLNSPWPWEKESEVKK